MPRVVVLGPPGSGKSTLARALGATFGVPVFHLDQAFFRPGWVEVERPSFDAAVAAMVALPEWVIEGNYGSTLAPRLGRADTLIYLDVPAWVSLVRVVRRWWRLRGQVREDSATGCVERLDWAFLWFVVRWNAGRRARYLAMVEGFAGRGVVVRMGAERNAVLGDVGR